MAQPAMVESLVTVTPEQILDRFNQIIVDLEIMQEVLTDLCQLIADHNIELRRKTTCTGGGPWSG